MGRRYIRWRNTHARDRQLTELVNAQTLLDAPLERERVGRFDGGPAGALRRERRDELTEW